ncbi:hypothetical protein SH584_07230 [Sphingomonas sp. LY29]|uniref:hypothetical protein n=1 Tax=Sphingomonas sp. LY29 TaxID=3095341 RepID=UPI002D76740F|nr:hypothetical protein [Sphingomonas sp. LY29]WRP24854.1 hypothetical protein SH584_07230 [Sphingomonas sp. LY29]
MNRMTLTATAAAAIGVGLTLAAPAEAQRWNDRGWRTLAYTTVDGRDRDMILVPGRARQNEVRLCALNAPIVMRDIDVRFDNGRRQDFNTRGRIAAGTCTRALDLRGWRSRDIERVNLRYEPIQRGARRPVIRVQVR